MAEYNGNLHPGSRVHVLAGLRKHSPNVSIHPMENCEVVALPTNGQPADAIAIRRPDGEIVWVDANLLWRARVREATAEDCDLPVDR